MKPGIVLTETYKKISFNFHCKYIKKYSSTLKYALTESKLMRLQANYAKLITSTLSVRPNPQQIALLRYKTKQERNKNCQKV